MSSTGSQTTILLYSMIRHRPSRSLAAENLFLRKQLALFSATTADWTLQQLREAIPADHEYRFLIRDRDAKFSSQLDRAINRLHLQILKTPVRSPKANAVCERTIGTIRRECLDYLIALGERHLCRILAEWITHFNAARPHSALGPGIPHPPIGAPVELRLSRQKMPPGVQVTARPVLGGLHHEYGLQLAA